MLTSLFNGDGNQDIVHFFVSSIAFLVAYRVEILRKFKKAKNWFVLQELQFSTQELQVSALGPKSVCLLCIAVLLSIIILIFQPSAKAMTRIVPT